MPTPVCIHLSGPPYEEYILCIHTRSLGGISQEFHAWAACQLFPYKNFLPLEKDPKQKDLENILFVETPGKSRGTKSTPADGNDKLKATLWTKAEKRAFDKAMLGWARWEVDYINGFVRSTRCEGTTINGDWICDRCKEVSRDKSLKHAIWRVSGRSLNKRWEIDDYHHRKSPRWISHKKININCSWHKQSLHQRHLRVLMFANSGTNCEIPWYSKSFSHSRKTTTQNVFWTCTEQRKKGSLITWGRSPSYVRFLKLDSNMKHQATRTWNLVSDILKLLELHDFDALTWQIIC